MTDQRLEHERLANPKTVADIEAAIRNPYSPIHKELVNEILLSEDWHMLLDRIIEEHVLQHYQMEKLEERQLYMSLLAQKIEEQQRLQLFHAKEGNSFVHEGEIVGLDKGKFIERLDERAGLIDKLRYQYDDISRQYETLAKEEKQIKSEWKALTVKHAAEFSQEIKEKQVKLYNHKGEQVAKDESEVENVIAKAFKIPSPVDLLEKIVSSHEKYNEVYQRQQQKAESAKSDTPPPPPPAPMLSPALSNPLAMAGMCNILNEIKLNAICAGETDSAKNLLAAIKNNKVAGEMLAKNDSIIEDNKTIYGKAIDHFKRGHELKVEKESVEQKLRLEESLQQQEIEKFKEQTGEDYRPGTRRSK